VSRQKSGELKMPKKPVNRTEPVEEKRAPAKKEEKKRRRLHESIVPTTIYSGLSRD
jgi:hypothetical protein